MLLQWNLTKWRKKSKCTVLEALHVFGNSCENEKKWAVLPSKQDDARALLLLLGGISATLLLLSCLGSEPFCGETRVGTRIHLGHIVERVFSPTEVPRAINLLVYSSYEKVNKSYPHLLSILSVVCEAMLCKCIPVGTNSNGIPTAIGDCGFILQGRTAGEAARLVKNAMDSPASLGDAARRRIEKNFTWIRRSEF